jgi:hypothetical protein
MAHAAPFIEAIRTRSTYQGARDLTASPFLLFRVISYLNRMLTSYFNLDFDQRKTDDWG